MLFRSSKSGEKGQLLHLLEKMDDRRSKLEVQRLDVEMAIEEIDRVALKARNTLAEITAKEKKK